MGVLIAVETVVLAIMAVLIAGLLRSHAEILRRLAAAESGSSVEDPDAVEGLPAPRESTTPVFDISGTTLAGGAVSLALTSVGTNTLIAFLSSGCGACLELWAALRDPARAELPEGARLVVVTKDPDMESPRKLRGLAPEDVPVVMSTRAWEDYDVPHSPFFIYVDGASGEIHGEGSAVGWDQVLSLLADALDDARYAEASGSSRRAVVPRDTEEDVALADADLRAAGIGPGHPSLYEP